MRPCGHADDAAAIGAGGVQRVQVAQHGDAVAPVDVAQRIHHQPGIHRIERGDRLIGQQDARLLHQRPRDRDALLLAARQRVGPVQRHFGDSQPIQRADRQRAFGAREQLQQRAGRGTPVQPAGQHVGQHVQPRHQIELLEDHRGAGAPAVQRPPTQPRDVAAVDSSRPVGRFDQPVDHAQQRGFSGTGAADDADHLPGGNAQRCIGARQCARRTCA